MDPFTRQQGQHLEYDPKCGPDIFNLQFHVASCTSLFISWCATDKNILVEAYKILTDALKKIEDRNNCSAIYWNYDNVTAPVSIHLPLTRCFTALCLHLQTFNLNFDSLDIQYPKLSLVQIIEPILRVQLLRAQVKAGMWVRNGPTLLQNLVSYHNVIWRTEMLDQDITLLQIAASHIESNKFLIHILNKFDLDNWAMPPMTIKSSESNNNKILIEELLHLLIVIAGERHVPGVSHTTTEDRIKKEIIQHLCIKSVPHSKLIKAIPTNLISKVTTIDKLIEEVAVLEKSSLGNGKALYKLKDQYHDEYNVFFYHYTPDELSKAQEFQQNIRKSKGKVECCPPPVLPRLTKFFAPLVNIFQCDVMLHIMRLILKGYLDKKEIYSESQIHMVLHLIGYALLEEETKYYSFLNFIKNATKFKIFLLLDELLRRNVIDCQKELLKWILFKYRSIRNEKGNHVSLQIETSHEKFDTERDKRVKLAAARREKLLEEMRKMQQKFIHQNSELYEEQPPVKQKKFNPDEVMHVKEVLNKQDYIALGPNQSAKKVEKNLYTCIFCKEENNVTIEGQSMVMLAFVYQATTLVHLRPTPHISTCGHIMHSECWKTYLKHRNLNIPEPFTSAELKKYEYNCPLCERLSNTIVPILPQLSTLQPDCKEENLSLEQWIENIRTLLSNTNFFAQSTNSLLENYNEFQANFYQTSDLMFINDFSLDLYAQFRKLFCTPSNQQNQSHKNMIRLSANITSTVFNNKSLCHKKIAPVNWQSYAYTMQSIVLLLRESNKPLLGQLSFGHGHFIENLTKLMSALGSTFNIQSYALKLLTILFEDSSDSNSILHWDSFGCLVGLTFSLRNVLRKSISISTGGTLDLFLLKIMFVCHITKLIIVSKHKLDSFIDANSTDREDESELLLILDIIGKKTQNMNSHLLWKYIKNGCLLFLRCCVLFYHHFTNVPVPAKLNEVGGDTFENMCSYLDLPQTPKDLFASKEIIELVKCWSNHKEIVCFLKSESENLSMFCEPWPIRRLVKLPVEYCELVKIVLTFTCAKHRLNPEIRCICLICGDFFCLLCTLEHATKCGAGVGVILNITECKVLLHAKPQMNGYIAAPYIDDYGETDDGFLRGNRLKLCPKRYQDLESLWLNHRIHETIFRTNQQI